MTTISEHTDDTKKQTKETETEGTMTVSESEMDYTDETDEVEISRKADDTKGINKYPDESDDTKDTIKSPDESDDFSEYKKPIDLKDRKPEGKRLSKKPEEKVKTKVTRTKIISAPPKEDTEKIAEIPGGRDGASMYDPLAGLELYGVSYKPKERPAPRKQETDIEREVEETEETKATRIKKESNIISVPPKEDTENIIEIPRHRGGGSVYDPLAGLELYGVNYKSKGRSVPVRQEMDAGEKTEEAEEIEKTEETEEIQKTEEVEETEKTTEKKLEKDVLKEETKQTAKVKVDKSTDLPDRSRSTQTKLQSRVKRVSEAPDIKESRKMSKEPEKKLASQELIKKDKKKKHRKR